MPSHHEVDVDVDVDVDVQVLETVDVYGGD